MTIHSNHSMVQAHAALPHTTGKPSSVNAVGFADESGDFADVMGVLLAAGSTDLTPTPLLTALAQQLDPGNTAATAETSLAQQTPTGQFGLVADLSQTPGLALAPAICAPVVASAQSPQVGDNTLARRSAAPVGYRTIALAQANNSPAEVVSQTYVLGPALDKPVPQRLVETEALGTQGMERAPATAFGASKDDAPMHTVAAVLSQRVQPGVEALQAVLAVPGMPHMPDNKDRIKTALVGAGLGLSGPDFMSDRLGMSGTYEVTQASTVVAAPQIAETVSYWAAQGIQNAELTVEGLGMEPVQVHIALDGDQVQVDFRSDQQQVRQVIEAATAQLKGLLLTQGIELSAMSVGSFGQGAHPSGARTPRPTNTRVTGVQRVQDVQAVPLRSLDSTVGQALDLYV